MPVLQPGGADVELVVAVGDDQPLQLRRELLDLPDRGHRPVPQRVVVDLFAALDVA